MKLAELLFFLSAATYAQNAYACACCSNLATFQSDDAGRELRWSAPVRLSGDIGVYIYGESGGPGIAVGDSAVRGTSIERKIVFTASKDGQALGDLELEFVGVPEIERIGMDIILPQSEYKRLELPLEPPIYHQWKQKVLLKASQKLRKNLGIEFSKSGLLVLHGYSNACWSPTSDYSGNWTLTYQVSKGNIEVRGLGRGTFE